jgi:DNA-binding GntR family transcriptional regulator
MSQKQITQSATIGKRRISKHSFVTNAIVKELRSGSFKLGGLLPTESKLAVKYSCSRHTIRVALRTLYERGLVISHQGKGTIVQSLPSPAHYRSTHQTLEDLLQYAAESSREILGISKKEVTSQLAEWLGSSSGCVWWEIKTIRRRKHDQKVFAASSIYVPQSCEEAVLTLPHSELPLFSMLERLPKHQIAKIEQTFSVSKVTKEESIPLELRPDDPVMSVERRFYDGKGRLIEVARSVHPPELYEYQMTLRQIIGPKH